MNDGFQRVLDHIRSVAGTEAEKVSVLLDTNVSAAARAPGDVAKSICKAVATRNVRDFEDTSIKVIDLWAEP